MLSVVALHLLCDIKIRIVVFSRNAQHSFLLYITLKRTDYYPEKV